MTCDEPLRRGRACAAKPSAAAALLAATTVWGSTFIVTKNTLESFHPASLITWRSGIAAAVLTVVG